MLNVLFLFVSVLIRAYFVVNVLHKVGSVNARNNLRCNFERRFTAHDSSFVGNEHQRIVGVGQLCYHKIVQVRFFIIRQCSCDAHIMFLPSVTNNEDSQRSALGRF